MKTSIVLGLCVAAVALLWTQGAVTHADQAATDQIIFYVH